jgi:hypothetical protein
MLGNGEPERLGGSQIMERLWMSRPQQRSWTTCMGSSAPQSYWSAGRRLNRAIPPRAPSELGRHPVVPRDRRLSFHSGLVAPE